ncbi:MAG: adenosine-specific kinase [Candidatus Thermoplasmatota archaeon]|nr:adenosine-specific kinase [Candidatus Thermoplasmatota archaeon]
MSYAMDIISIRINKGEEENVILGQTHFIKSIEDIYESLKNSTPGGKFGIAFCEASGKRLVRVEGNDEELMKEASENAMRVGAGHFFIIHLKETFPINTLPHLRSVPEILNIYAATSNPLSVVVAQEGEQRGVLGVLDGEVPLGIEGEEDRKERKEFLRKIGYKL